jgi:radical SAM superfamily enzyme YgiQ (UPF0313 family)
MVKTTQPSTLPGQPQMQDLTAPGAILLVACYELGHQPLSLAFPLAVLRAADYDPAAVDTSVETLTDTAIHAARLVAISVPMHTALRLGIEVAERVRRVNPHARICFYGLYAWLNADYLLREHGDYAIAGEPEQALLALVRALESGARVPIPGVSDRHTRATPVIERLDLPVPDRSNLPAPRHYAHLLLDGEGIPAGYTEATRGCHHTCLHCPIVPVYGGRFFAVPRATVMEDIRRQVRAGVGHITFGDPDFLNGPTHALRICRELHAEFPHLTFDFTARIEHLLERRAMLPEFRALGCVFVLTAVESVSDHVLRELDKGHTRQDVIAALGALDAAGITMRPSLLPFTPWTTLDDYLELLEFFEVWDLVRSVDPVHFAIRLLVPPGSALLAQLDTSWLGELDEPGFTWTWRHPDPRMDDLQRAISTIVEQDARSVADPAATFARIKALAWQVAGRTPPPVVPQRTAPPGDPPRLTEAWFC